jgi:hypothetical protein
MALNQTKLDPEIKEPGIYTLSIEPCNGPTYLHGFHLGTHEHLARQFAEEMYKRINAERGCFTVALIRNGHMWDTFDGRDWFSDTVNNMWDEENARAEQG